MVEVIKIMATSFKRSCAHTAVLSAPDPAAGHRRPTPPPETPGHSWESLAQSLVGSLLLSPRSWCTQDFVCTLQEPVSPVLCMFWWLYGEVNGDLLQEGLCYTLVCCTQSPCPCSRPLLTYASIGDTQTLKGRSGSVSVESPGVHKILFVCSKSLFPKSCVCSGGSMVGLMATSSKKTYAIPRSAAPRAPAPAEVETPILWPPDVKN